MTEAMPATGGLRFSKMHGAGNDFVMLDLRGGQAPPSPALAAALADRHRGIGCDQIITLEDPRSADAIAAYGIWNSDGSPSQQCGNGARCAAAWLQRAGVARGDSFVLDSPQASHKVEHLGHGQFAIAMGVPQFNPGDIPMHGFDHARPEYDVAVDEDLRLRFGAVSMGNPHAVMEVPSVAQVPVAAYGRALQQSTTFPQSVNVGFAEIVDRSHIRLRVYERGVGETLACGSGACAAAVVLMQRDRVDRDVAVELPGGTLRVQWPRADASVTMAGPTAFVFEGHWNP
ncbi:diaminopimelate epimerase [Pseudoxanthomonas dokdonensis]|uniref:Diaminopimelate epimerase n=1 Tax=Pseudoxanthomonas dokdonensis TaxID=344882 RepID=A0A0R0CVJ1_9GAMM|nr:diaminopimelate epimerase [Pseudoxanthomonas dokdonensis]KRG70394.1 diaminopimelate epimerase [Pseudoxanthomonas dokdonensis]